MTPALASALLRSRLDFTGLLPLAAAVRLLADIGQLSEAGAKSALRRAVSSGRVSARQLKLGGSPAWYIGRPAAREVQS